jgi:TM2 domain-containing membrane protein YozV
MMGQAMVGQPMMSPQPVVMQMSMATVPGTSRNRGVAALLAFFLGGLGAHKFYLGRTGMGVLYLLICWTFIPAILSLIEGIILLAQSDESFARTYPG